MRKQIISTSTRGIHKDLFPYRLYEKSKKLGIWNPQDIDLTQDKKDWNEMSTDQQNRMIRLVSKFQAGEEAVTLDLLPLVLAIAQEGRLEEEMFLTTFLFEEAKHTEFFRMFLDAIHVHDDLSKYHTPAHRKMFYEILPETMQKLLRDQSPEVIVEASVVYNMIVEGILAETGYFAFYRMLEASGKMPGFLKGIDYLKRDESRHIAYGTFLLQRIVCEHPHLYDVIEQRMNELQPLANSITEESLADNDPSILSAEDAQAIMHFSRQQYIIRLEKIKRAQNRTIDELYRMSVDE